MKALQKAGQDGRETGVLASREKLVWEWAEEACGGPAPCFWCSASANPQPHRQWECPSAPWGRGGGSARLRHKTQRVQTHSSSFHGGPRSLIPALFHLRKPQVPRSLCGPQAQTISCPSRLHPHPGLGWGAKGPQKNVLS